jgi:hypothetical protein
MATMDSSEVAYRPNRIGKEGVTKRWSFREDDALTLAAREQAKANGTTLSDIVRARVRAYLGEEGWNIDHLMSKDEEIIDAEWMSHLGRTAPRDRTREGRRAAVDPGGTRELF